MISLAFRLNARECRSEFEAVIVATTEIILKTIDHDGYGFGGVGVIT